MRVLLADDDPVARRVLSAVLRRLGYDVQAVSDGTAAWGVLSGADPPPIALLDWEMPGIDGLEICRRVRSLARDAYTFLVLLTAREGHRDLLTGLEAGADEYLRKPCDHAELAARICVGARITSLQSELLAAREALRVQAFHDGLTGALNRTGVHDALAAEVAALARRGGSLGIAMVDLDHFKRVNDTWGHPAGDAVLKEATARVRGVLRPYDRVGRVGGEEFLVVLPDCDGAALASVAERIRAAIADLPFSFDEAAIPVTCSVGFGGITDPAAAKDVVRRVDEALYRAKNGGRNRVMEAI